MNVDNSIEIEKKVLLLSCGTGGGHNSAARAIQEILQEKGILVDFKEYLDIVNPKLRARVNNLYIKSTNANGKIFKVVYRLGEMYQKTNLKSPVYALNFLNRNKVYQYIVKHNYRYVITTHLFAAQTLTAIKKEHPIKYMQVATDYVCIPFWGETNPDYFVIPSIDLKPEFTKAGLPERVLLPFGIPTAKAYRESYSTEEYKEKLGLDMAKDYVLVLTGSMGFGNVLDMVKALKKNLPTVHFIISTGNNKKLLQSLEKEYKNVKDVILLPYTKNISQYMKSSKIILTKPGGLTTTEIATLRKPCILTMPIPGCENYNAKFFADRKMALRCNSIPEIVENTRKLLQDKTLQASLIQNQQKYIKQDTCNKITNHVLQEIE